MVKLTLAMLRSGSSTPLAIRLFLILLFSIGFLNGQVVGKTTTEDYQAEFERQASLYSIPEYFGDWSAIYRRFNLWSKKGILIELFNTLNKLSDLEWKFIDGSIVKAHQHSAGSSSGQKESIIPLKSTWRLIATDYLFNSY